MKYVWIVLWLTCASFVAAQKQEPKQVVEVSCGQCQFGLQGKGCDLAVRIDGKAYFVSGTTIDAHGDAHAHDGFCNAIRQAEVTGTLKNDTFVVTSFRLLPPKEAPKK